MSQSPKDPSLLRDVTVGLDISVFDHPALDGQVETRLFDHFVALVARCTAVPTVWA